MPRLQRLLLSLLFLVTVPAVLATLLSLLTAQVWWLKLLDFPRFQLLLLHLGLLLALAGLLGLGRRQRQPLRRWVLGLNLLGGLVQLGFLLNYAPLGSRPVPDATAAQAADSSARLRLLEANVWQHNQHPERLLARVRAEQPDLVLAVETDQRWVRALRPLRQQYPYFVELPRPNTYGLVLYSRRPLLRPRVHYFQEPDVPTLITDVQLPNGRLVRLYAVHPTPPVPSRHPTSLDQPNLALLQVGERVKKHQGPALVLGDFNDVPWSQTTRLFGIRGVVHNVRLGRGLFSTFDADSRLMRWPLDHLFVTREFRLVRLARLPGIGSDHFPLLAEVVLAE